MIVGVEFEDTLANTYRAGGPWSPQNGVDNKVDNGGGRRAQPSNAVVPCRSIGPRTFEILFSVIASHRIVKR